MTSAYSIKRSKLGTQVTEQKAATH